MGGVRYGLARRGWCGRKGAGIREEGEVGWSSWEGRLRRALKGMQSICFCGRGKSGGMTQREWDGRLTRQELSGQGRGHLGCRLSLERGWRLTFGWGRVEDSGSWKPTTNNQSIVLMLHPDPTGDSGVSWGV